MNAQELLEYIGCLLDIDFPLGARQHFTNELYRDLLRENRELAEAQGIGKDSELSEKVLYSIQEACGRLIKDDPSVVYFCTLPPEYQDYVLSRLTERQKEQFWERFR